MKNNSEYKKAIRAAGVFSIIADPTRCRIITFLAQAKGEEKCVYEVAETIGLTHSAASHQLNKMEDLQLVTCERHGQTMCYQLAETEFAGKVARVLETFYK